jgi:hypothetical protein
MAYAQSGGDSSKMPLILGGVALVYLWYEGYLASWFPSIFGTSVASSTPTTSVATGSTTQTVSQASGIPSLTQLASTSVVEGGAKRVIPTGLLPIHS